MDVKAVIFAFFVVLAATLNFGFVVGVKLLAVARTRHAIR